MFVCMLIGRYGTGESWNLFIRVGRKVKLALVINGLSCKMLPALCFT